MFSLFCVFIPSLCPFSPSFSLDHSLFLPLSGSCSWEAATQGGGGKEDDVRNVTQIPLVFCAAHHGSYTLLLKPAVEGGLNLELFAHIPQIVHSHEETLTYPESGSP